MVPGNTFCQHFLLLLLNPVDHSSLEIKTGFKAAPLRAVVFPDAVVQFSTARSRLRGRISFILQFKGLSVSRQEFAQFCSIMPVADGGVQAGSLQLCATQNLFSESYKVDYLHLTVSGELHDCSFRSL